MSISSNFIDVCHIYEYQLTYKMDQKNLKSQFSGNYSNKKKLKNSKLKKIITTSYVNHLNSSFLFSSKQFIEQFIDVTHIQRHDAIRSTIDNHCHDLISEEKECSPSSGSKFVRRLALFLGAFGKFRYLFGILFQASE